MNLYTLFAIIAVAVVVRIGVYHPASTTVVLVLLAGAGIGLYRRRSPSLPPTRHMRRSRINNIVD